MKLLTLQKLKDNCIPSNEWPDFIRVNTSDIENSEQLEIQCRIPQDLKWFEGHYPDQAVLPGVVQVNWATELAQKIFPTNKFNGVNALKFNTMILPDTELSLRLTNNLKTGSISFSYSNNETRFSSGKIIFNTLKETVSDN